jgi:hypothetical protein
MGFYSKHAKSCAFSSSQEVNISVQDYMKIIISKSQPHIKIKLPLKLMLIY